MTITDQLEEAVTKLYETDNALSYDQAIQLSIAISLKRIADKLYIPFIANFDPEEAKKFKEDWDKSSHIVFKE